MAADVMNLFVIIAVGVILANMVSNKNASGTTALFCNMGNLWKISVNGMLGNQTTLSKCS